MAIKKVKLPNNTVVDINDARIPGVDSSPTSGSGNVVTSGGVFTEMAPAFVDAASAQDGAVVLTKKNGDTVTIDLNHTHPDKQDLLVSGTNIKTINNESILGSGNITIQGGTSDAVLYTQQSLTTAQQEQARTNIGAGTYSKPSGGIPGTDLASGVVPVTDVTVGGSSVVSSGTAVVPAIPTTVASLTDASNYPKYVLLADEAAYTALATKDSGTLYLIPKTS